jgi:hypothetical protein
VITNGCIQTTYLSKKAASHSLLVTGLSKADEDMRCSFVNFSSSVPGRYSSLHYCVDECR